MFCSHCMCLDSDLVVQKINKQTSKQADKRMKKQCAFICFIVHEIANCAFLLCVHAL